MKLKVNWAPEQLLTFEQVIARPGYYLNGMSGDIYFQDGHAPEATTRHVGAIEAASRAGRATADPHIWLFITDNLDLTEAEVRATLRDALQLRIEDQGRLLNR